MIVPVKSAAALLSLDGHLHAGSIGEINIQPTIAIVIEQDYAAAHRLHDVLLGRIGGMFKADARFGCDILQLRDRTASALKRLSSRRRRGRRGMALLAKHKIRDHEDQEKHPDVRLMSISAQSFSFSQSRLLEFCQVTGSAWTAQIARAAWF